MLEIDIEKYACQQAEDHGAVVRKVLYSGRVGAPDRWFFFPGGRLLIVEFKKARQRPSVAQRREMKTLQELGFEVHWTDSREGFDKLLKEFLND